MSYKDKPIKWPRISIVTPCFNMEEYLECTIQSIVSQKYPNLEYIIVDGGSTDRSVDIIKKYDGALEWWVSESDNGMYHAIQKGFSKATGEIMAWLNADDMYHSKALFSVAQIFDSFPNIEWIQGRPTLFDEDGRIFKVGKIKKWSKYDIY